MRALWRGLILLSLWLGGWAASAQPALQPALIAAERMPPSQRDQRIATLQAMATQPGSAEALDRLYLMGLALGQDGDSAALQTLDAEWRAWTEAASAPQRELGKLAQTLLQVRTLLNAGRYREALASYAGPPDDRLRQLPLIWQLRAASVQGAAREETGDLEAALLLRLEAVTLAQATAQDWRTVNAVYDLAYTHSRLGQNERALEKIQQLLAMLPADASDDERSRAHNLHGIVLQNAGRSAEALEATELALTHARRDGDRRNIALLLANLSDSYLKAGQAQRALTLANEAYDLALALKYTSTMSLALHNRGVAKIVLGRVAEGKELVKRSITLELQAGGTTYAADGWRELGQYLERAGDLAGAFEAFDAYRQLADGLSQADRRKALSEAQARFDEAQRQRERSLLQQQNQLREETIKSQRLNGALGAVALASAAALAALLWLLYRRLRRANAQLAVTNRELAAQSEVDPLTGLGNRRRLQQLVGRSEGGLQATLLLIDIDHFKMLNDRFGHAGGDAVLVAIAGRLRSAVREPLGVMRWGGEEFLLLVQGNDPALADALAQRLLNEIAAEPVALRDGRHAPVSASVGYAVLPLPGSGLALDAERAVDLVDALMYQAKSHGRNQAWGLLGTQLDKAEALRSALSDLAAAEAAGVVELHRCAGPTPGSRP